jgi:hypothetical protein
MADPPEMSPELAVQVTSYRWFALILVVMWITIVPIDLILLPSYNQAYGWDLLLKASVDSILATVAVLFTYSVYRLGVCAEQIKAEADTE